MPPEGGGTIGRTWSGSSARQRNTSEARHQDDAPTVLRAHRQDHAPGPDGRGGYDHFRGLTERRCALSPDLEPLLIEGNEPALLIVHQDHA